MCVFVCGCVRAMAPPAFALALELHSDVITEGWLLNQDLYGHTLDAWVRSSDLCVECVILQILVCSDPDPFFGAINEHLQWRVV